MRSVVILLSVSSIAAQQPPESLLGRIDSSDSISAHLVADLDGDGSAEFVLASANGTVRVWSHTPQGESTFSAGAKPLVLARPASTLLTIADVAPETSGLELVVADARGVVAYGFDATHGRFSGDPLTLTPSRLGFRTGRPMAADLAQDINDDGLADLTVPARGGYEIWLRDATKQTMTFEFSQTLPLQLGHERRTRASLLSDQLSNKIEIPRLDIDDVNGDGRADLRTKRESIREFYMQDADGRFATAPITVDLAMFRDTTAKAGIDLGETLVIDGTAYMQDGDLNGDGVPDYVIAHRRKVWSFLSSEAGPQFTKSRTRRVAQDISGLLLARLDEDERDDLLVFKLEVPSATELLLGLVASIDVEVTAIGYRTDEDGAFERRARWQRPLTIRVPPIRELMSGADDLIERFLAVIEKLRWSARGDFDGDGTLDLALATEANDAAEIWLNREKGKTTENVFGAWIRGLLFESPDTVFDVDRILELLGQVIELRNSALTARRAPDRVMPLRPVGGELTIVEMLATDVDGDGREEVVLVEESKRANGRRVLSVFDTGGGR